MTNLSFFRRLRVFIVASYDVKKFRGPYKSGTVFTFQNLLPKCQFFIPSVIEKAGGHNYTSKNVIETNHSVLFCVQCRSQSLRMFRLILNFSEAPTVGIWLYLSNFYSLQISALSKLTKSIESQLTKLW